MQLLLKTYSLDNSLLTVFKTLKSKIFVYPVQLGSRMCQQTGFAVKRMVNYEKQF